MLVAMRAAHGAGKKNFGLDVHTAQSVDRMKGGVVQPLRVKTQAIFSAAEAAIMILRIDDIITSSKSAALKEAHRLVAEAGCPREYVNSKTRPVPFFPLYWSGL